MRLTFLFSAVLLTACAPEDAEPIAFDDASLQRGTATKAGEVEVAGGPTAATDKDCDPNVERDCYDFNKIVTGGGGNDIHPDPTSDDPIPEFPFGGPNNASLFLTANSGIPGVAMTLAYDERDLAAAAARRNVGYVEAFVTGQPAGSTIREVHILDTEMRTGEYSLLIELDDASTWLVEGGIPSGHIEFD